MRESLAQQSGLVWALVAAVMLAALALLLFVARRRLRNEFPRGGELPEAQAQAEFTPPVTGLDSATLAAALREAETAGEQERLPGLYLALAQCRLDDGETSEAKELLRKSLRDSGNRRHHEVHARARLALGDLARADGDLTTACEHWQMARAIFHELKQDRDHEAVEMRMRQNGCPTDWVLTDF